MINKHDLENYEAKKHFDSCLYLNEILLFEPIKKFLFFVKENISTISAPILYVILFGSYARGTAKITSDVDLAVFSSLTLTINEIADVHLLLDEYIPYINYDLFFSTPQRLTTNCIFDANYHIKKEGVIVYEK